MESSLQFIKEGTSWQTAIICITYSLFWPTKYSQKFWKTGWSPTWKATLESTRTALEVALNNVSVLQCGTSVGSSTLSSIKYSSTSNERTAVSIAAKLARLTKATITGSTSLICIQNGFKQGVRLVEIVFNLSLVQVTKKIAVDTKGILLYESAQVLVYVVDINILSRFVPLRSNGSLMKFDNAVKRVGLHVNEQKARIMTQRKNINLMHLMWEGELHDIYDDPEVPKVTTFSKLQWLLMMNKLRRTAKGAVIFWD